MTEENLRRLLSPKSVAIVGASEPRSNNAVLPMKARGIELVYVNPNRDTVYGAATVPSLRHAGRPVDAVLSMVSADRTLDVIQDAVAIGAGGVVITAAGFAEVGPEGKKLQDAIHDVAVEGGLEVCGPNCLGIISPVSGSRLTTAPDIPIVTGDVAVISHSGGLVRSLMSGAEERRIGFSHLISVGNEAVTDIVDFINGLIDEGLSRVICLCIESIR